MTRRVVFTVFGGLLTIAAVFLISLRERPNPRSASDSATADEDGLRRPSEWHWLQRTWPYYQADADVMRRALDERSRLKRLGKTSSEWTFLGPTNIGGRIVDIEFNPKNPEIVYAAAATGGVFRSNDGASTWQPVFDEQAVLTVGDIAIDPRHPDTLYVGTGEANGGHNNFAGGGVYRSTNGGTSWQYVGLEEVVSIGRIVVDPLNSDRVFVAAVGSYFAPHPERGVFRSTNGGGSWENVLFVSDSTGAVDLAINERSPDTLFAAAWERARRPNGNITLGGSTSGIYRSIDGGDTWSLLGPEVGLPDASNPDEANGLVRVGRIGVSVNRSNPSVVHALYTDGLTFLGLYVSRDGGDSWTDVPLAQNDRSGFADFSWYFGQVRSAPSDPDRIYLLDLAITSSEDGGESWSIQTGTHVDHHAFAFHPHDDTIILDGNDGGLARSEDGGKTWSRIRGLPVTQFYEVAFDPGNPNDVFGGTQDNGTIRSYQSRDDAWYSINGGDGFYVIVDPDDPNTIYTSTQNGALYRSGTRLADAGQYKSNWSTPVVLNPDDSNILYYGADRLLRSNDRGNTWTALSDNLTSHGYLDRLGTITTIAVAPSDTSVIYLGTDDGNVWVTRDSGLSWNSINSGLPRRWVTRVAVEESNPEAAVVTFSGLKWRDPQPHVFRTTDYGESWRNISGNLPDAPINALAIDPAAPGTIYVGTDVGAYVTADDGQTWNLLGSGLPAVPVYDLKLVPSTRVLIAGTHGRSMYSLDLNGPVSTEGVREAVSSTASAYPNPFVEWVAFEFEGLDFGSHSLQIFDTSGRLVRTIAFQVNSESASVARWDGTDEQGIAVASGMYFARVGARDRIAGPTLQVIRIR